MKNYIIVGLLLISAGIINATSFAGQDYHGRNIFNHIADWTATVGKDDQQRQQIIDERINLRASRRMALDHKNEQAAKIDQQYNTKLDDLNKDKAGANIEDARKKALEDLELKYGKEKVVLKYNRDNDKNRDLKAGEYVAKEGELNARWEKEKADINHAYDMKKAALN